MDELSLSDRVTMVLFGLVMFAIFIFLSLPMMAFAVKEAYRFWGLEY